MNIDRKIATRQSFGEALAELGKNNENIVVLDSDLSTATKTSIFAKEFPERFFFFLVCQLAVKFHLLQLLQFLLQVELMIKLEIVYVILI